MIAYIINFKWICALWQFTNDSGSAIIKYRIKSQVKIYNKKQGDLLCIMQIEIFSGGMMSTRDDTKRYK